MLKFRCTTCEQKIGVPDDWANHLVRCPRCKSAIPVPRVLEVEVKRVPVFAEPVKPAATAATSAKKAGPAPQPRGAAGAKPQAAKRKAPRAKPAAADPVITKASAPTDGAVFAKPPVQEPVAEQTPALVDQGQTSGQAPSVDAPKEISEKKEPSRPMAEALRWAVEPGITSPTAVADLLKDLGSDGSEVSAAPSDLPPALEKVVEPRPRPRRGPINYGGWALAAVGFLAGAAGLGLGVVPAWTRFSMAVAIFGLMLAVLATVGRAGRRGGEAVLAVAAFVVCGLGALMALLVSGGILPAGPGGRGVAQPSKTVLSERKGDVEIRVTSVGVVHPVIYASGQWKTLRTAPQPCLQIDLELHQLRPAGKLAYRSWGRFQDGTDPPALTDNEGNPLKLLDFAPLTPPGRPRESVAYLDGSRHGISDVLLFEVPPAAAETLDLQLPGANFGADGVVEFHIPAGMLRR